MVYEAPSDDSKKDIPLPGVVIRREYELETPEDFNLPEERYLRYSTPSWLGTEIHFDRNRIEYCIDDEDINWISEQRIPASQLDEEAMEILLDILEKESFRQLEFRQINAAVAQVIPNDEPVDEDDKPCSACGGKDWDEENLILFCDGCDLPIHQACQDLVHVPDGDWYCDTCLYRMVPTTTASKPSSSSTHSRTTNQSKRASQSSITSSKPKIDFSILIPCVMCGMVDGGPFKRTHLPGHFVHICCALMSQDVWFESDSVNVSRIVNTRTKQPNCAVCGHSGGVVKCSQRNCNVQYHVTCARENGQQLYFHVPDPEECDPLLNESSNALALQDAIEISKNASLECVLANGHTSKGDCNTGKASSASISLKTSRSGNEEDESEMVDVDQLSDCHSDYESGNTSLNTSTMSMPGTSTSSSKPKKSQPNQHTSKKRKRKAVKKLPHQPFQSLCAIHSGAIRAEKLEEARKASLEIAVDVGRFLAEEDEQGADVTAGDTTTFSKAVSILHKMHSSGHFALQKNVFSKVVEYWKAKRLSRRLGHMPFIFQLHVLVTHFKENFDAGRRLKSEPRQVEMKLAQYTMEKKFEMLRQLRDSVEILRTTLDLIKKRELKKRQSIVEKIALFDAAMQEEDKVSAIKAIFAPAIRGGPLSHPFIFSSAGKTMPMTIRLPVNLVRRVLAENNLSQNVVTVSGTNSRPSVSISQSSSSNSHSSSSSWNIARNSASSTATGSPPPRKKQKMPGETSSPTTIPKTAPITISDMPSTVPKNNLIEQRRDESVAVVKVISNPNVAVPPAGEIVKPAQSNSSSSLYSNNTTSSPSSSSTVVSPTKQMSITSYFSASSPQKPTSPPKVHIASIPSNNSNRAVSTPQMLPYSSIASNSAVSVCTTSNSVTSDVSNVDSTPSSPRSASLSSPMATPTKLSHIKHGPIHTAPLATSSPNVMSPIKMSPGPAVRVVEPMHIDVEELYDGPDDEEHILFNSGLPRSSLFEKQEQNPKSSSAMHVCND